MTHFNTYFSKKVVLLFGLFLISFLNYSCAPKKSGVRAQVKTGQTNLNPATSAVAEQQASAQNAIYKISTISLPVATDAGVVINSELLNPSNQYLPITTHHENGQSYSEGIYNDSARALNVHVNAKCSDSECSKYFLLVTVVRNNQAIYQSGAISYSSDCSFYSISISPSSGQMFTSLDAFISRYDNNGPIGDSNSCLQ